MAYHGEAVGVLALVVVVGAEKEGKVLVAGMEGGGVFLWRDARQGHAVHGVAEEHAYAAARERGVGEQGVLVGTEKLHAGFGRGHVVEVAHAHAGVSRDFVCPVSAAACHGWCHCRHALLDVLVGIAAGFEGAVFHGVVLERVAGDDAIHLRDVGVVRIFVEGPVEEGRFEE